MVGTDIGEATIVYEHPEEGTIETSVASEHLDYFQDHWLIKAGDDAQGNDVVRRIPSSRVYYVDRSVDEFHEEVQTVREQVGSVTRDLRKKLLRIGEQKTGREVTEIEIGDESPSE